jgi:hypothetical protein
MAVRGKQSRSLGKNAFEEVKNSTFGQFLGAHIFVRLSYICPFCNTSNNIVECSTTLGVKAIHLEKECLFEYLFYRGATAQTKSRYKNITCWASDHKFKSDQAYFVCRYIDMKTECCCIMLDGEITCLDTDICARWVHV